MGKMTLEEALVEYKNVYMAYRNFAERTRVEYQNDLESFLEFAEKFGITQVKKLGLSIIHRYLAQLEHNGYSNLTRKRRTVTIRSFLSFLYQDGYLDVNIAKRVVLPFTVNPKPKILTPDECNRLREACADNPRDRAIVELLLETGIKLSELTRLTANDIGISRYGDKFCGTVRIIGRRRKKNRVLPLGNNTSLAVREYLQNRERIKISALFLNRFLKPLKQRGVQKAIKKHFKKAGIDCGSIKSLRHTFASQNLTKGNKPQNIQDRMGYIDKRSMSMYYILQRERHSINNEKI